MKNWKKIAEMYELGIPAEQMERIGPALDGLEEVFRPLVKRIPHNIEPAVMFGFPLEEME